MCTSTLFVSGMQRSGTTLLARLLAGHRGVSLLSQPFPFVYVDAKRDFLASRGLPDGPYPLGPLFGDPGYRSEELAAFLDRYRPGRAALRETIDRMEGWSGRGTPVPASAIEAALDRLPEAPGLARLVAHLVDHAVAAVEDEPGAAFRGSKEIQCEELLPHMLERGMRCLIIVRDPRDVVASLNHGSGVAYGGRLKPTLFNVRNWRKSVAFALHLEAHPGFAWLRYEDLVARPAETLERIARWLGIGPFPAKLTAEGPVEPAGGRWSGNSSHGPRRGVSAASVGAWRHHLAPAAAELIDAACLPEMRLLGYPAGPAGLDLVSARGALSAFDEPYRDTRAELASYADSGRALEEIERLDRLAEPPGPESSSWFLFADVHERLRGALGRRAGGA